MSEPLRYPGTPRWVKISGIALGVLVLLIVVIVLAGVGGPHGPGRHAPAEVGAGPSVESSPMAGDGDIGHTMPPGGHQ
jgi:hypothetical protein